MAEFSDFTRHDVEQILAIVDKLGDVEVQFQAGDVKLFVRKLTPGAVAAQQAAAPAQQAVAAPVAAAPVPVAAAPAAAAAASASAPVAADAALPSGTVAVRAPMLGRFYRAPSPNDPPFVEVGQRVAAEDSVAIIEVMKLFNTIHAGVAGTIVEVRPANGDMVEFDQVLFVVRPD